MISSILIIVIFQINYRSSINELHETLKKTITGLEAGSYEQELNDEEYKIQKFKPDQLTSRASCRSVQEFPIGSRVNQNKTRI